MRLARSTLGALFLPWSLVAASLVAGCSGSSETAVVVFIDAEPGLRADTRRLRVEIYGSAGRDDMNNPAQRRDVYLTHDAPQLEAADTFMLEWPVRVVVSPLDGDATRVYRVRATAEDENGTTIGKAQVVSGYRKGQVLQWVLLLEDACRGILCTEDTTCRAAACVDDWISPDGLEPYRDAPVDAGLDAHSAPPVDAGLDADSAPPVDAGLDADSAPPVNGCTDGSAIPPPRPPPSTEGPAIDDLVFALKGIAVRDANVGLNLDGLCTGPEGPWSCLPQPELDKYLEGMDPMPHVDGPEGVDNEFAHAVYLLDGVWEDTPVDLHWRIALAQGHGNPLFILRDYNGEAEDPQVTVVVSQSVFVVPGEEDAAPDICIVDTDEGGVPHRLDDDGECDLSSPIGSLSVELDDPDEPSEIIGVHPAWESGDLWAWSRSDAFSEGDQDAPLVVLDNAYVHDWTLVIRLPDNSLLHLLGAPPTVDVRLHGAYAVVPLRPDLSGSDPGAALLAGRWSLNALERALDSAGICPGNVLRSTFEAQLVQRADVRTRAEDEGVDVACNALSFGFGFTAHRVHLGGLALGQPSAPNLCE